MFRVQVPEDCEDKLEYVRDQISSREKGPERSYLLQCANWAPSEFHENVWIAYSPIYSRYSGNSWPLYDINLEFCDESDAKIEFKSWKGDYDNQTRSQVYGNLDSSEKERYFIGTVWTRGE